MTTHLGFGAYVTGISRYEVGGPDWDELGPGDRYRPARERLRPVYHLAERFGPDGKQLSEHDGPFSREEAERQLRALMGDPPGDRDESLCVVEVTGLWESAEIVLTAEECL